MALVGPHFPAAMLNGNGPCWCHRDGCVRCWYANWHYCGDVMLARRESPVSIVVAQEEPKKRAARGPKVRDIGGQTYARGAHSVRVIAGTMYMKSQRQHWEVECMTCGHKYGQWVRVLRGPGPLPCPNKANHAVEEMKEAA